MTSVDVGEPWYNLANHCERVLPMSGARYHYPDALVSGDWLEEHLSDPDLRVFDCTTYLAYEAGTGRPYRVVSGRADYDAGHIPGSGFLDLQGDFSVKDSPYRFTLPSPDEAAAAFGQHGVGDDTHVVLYSRSSMHWATRFWWMLRWLGFDAAAILDGGYDKWVADGRAISTERSRYPVGELSINSRPELFVGRDEVLAAIGRSEVCNINALGRDLHSGENPRYGRPGRIPGSVNVPAVELVHPDTKEMLPPEAAAQAFAAVGADPARPVMTYCGGGIAATLDAFLLHQLGYEDIAVYDNSMSEWATDGTLPIETD
jgi:thiosulfate/3-mercaptopyruvate sulfurtransferase